MTGSATARLRVEEVSDASTATVDALADLARQLPRFQRPPQPEHIEQIIASPTTRLLVARDGEEIVGTLTLVLYQLPTGIRAWFEDVAVVRGGQSRGIGHMLTEAGVDLARRLGASDVVMLVKPTQTNALRALSSMGFSVDDEDTRRLRLN